MSDAYTKQELEEMLDQAENPPSRPDNWETIAFPHVRTVLPRLIRYALELQRQAAEMREGAKSG